MSNTMPTTARLPVIVLPYPRILLPTTGASQSLSRSHLGSLKALLQEDPDTRPHVLVVPALSPVKGSQELAPIGPIGVIAEIKRVFKAPVDGGNSLPFVYLQGTGKRARLCDTPLSSSRKFLELVDIELFDETSTPSKGEIEAFRSAALASLRRLVADPGQGVRRGVWQAMQASAENVSDDYALTLADSFVSLMKLEHSERLEYLGHADSDTRLSHATKLLVKHNSITEVSQKIASDVNENLSRQQKEFYLRQQLAAIQRELGQLNHPEGNRSPAPDADGNSVSELDDDAGRDNEDLDDLKRKIEALSQDSEERKVCTREWRRMKRIQAGSVEQGIIRSYLEWVTSLPWSGTTDDSLVDKALLDPQFLAKAREQLEHDHFGLDKIKRRLIEFLAVLCLKRMQAMAQENPSTLQQAVVQSSEAAASSSSKSVKVQKSRSTKAPILLFVGPPGVGKTSLGQSVARALNRPFQRVSLGGVRDEAEIRGHRRTYVASGPGVLAQALRKAGRLDPVILLDEIDKLTQSNHHGDPGAALLEVLDPEQNHTFNDHYINIPIDLSQVLFICTANSLDTISAPLLDRCEVVRLSGYTYDQKIHIAKRFLLPKQIEANALNTEQVHLTDGTLKAIVTQYTREAGVRNLERLIGSVVRWKALEWVETHNESTTTSSSVCAYKRIVDEPDLERILGPGHSDDDLVREQRVGLVYGMVVSGAGEGSTMPIEATAFPGSGKLKLTGSLGDVIKESAEIALSWVRAHAFELGITSSRNQDPLQQPRPIDIHVHLPAGAQRKDGPSAGIAMTCALVSLLTGQCVTVDTAMTGEITLRGRVAPVGGIKEKVLGAHIAQIRTVILPWSNRKDVEYDVPLEVQQNMKFVYVRTVEEVIDAAFGEGKVFLKLQPALMFDSHL